MKLYVESLFIQNIGQRAHVAILDALRPTQEFSLQTSLIKLQYSYED